MATRTIMLRAGDARDIATVESLMDEAFDPRFGEAWTRGQCLGVLAMPGVWLTIACVDDVPTGFAMTRIILDEAELLLLAVLPGQRRRGVGAALLRSVIADCGARGVRSLHLEVRAGNEAIELYVGHGFAKVGERRNYYRGRTAQSFDAHTFRRALG